MSYLDIFQYVQVEKWLNTRLEEIIDQQLKQYFYCFTLIRLRIEEDFWFLYTSSLFL